MKPSQPGSLGWTFGGYGEKPDAEQFNIFSAIIVFIVFTAKCPT